MYGVYIAVTKDNNELTHYGIPGMKWGHRKARPQTTGMGRVRATYRTNNQTSKSYSSQEKKAYKQTDEYKAQVKARRKKAIKIGAAVAGTALAAYGTYKLAKYVQNKRSNEAMKKASDYINNNVLKKVGESNFSNGNTRSYFENKVGTQITTGSARNKAIGQHNAKVVATGRQMYKDATNTRLDRALSKVVGAGDSVGNTAKRGAKAVGNTAKQVGVSVKRAGTNAKNRVLDVVKPIYTYTPGETSSKVRDIDGVKIKETVTNYRKTKIKR